MYKIKSLAVRETLEFQLKGPDDEPLTSADGKPIMAVIFGPGSKRHQAAQQAKTDKLMAKVMKGREAKLSGAEAAQQQVEFLTAITERLDLSYDQDGVELEGAEKFKAIYSDGTIGFIAEQVTQKVGDWGNFSSGSKKS